MMWRDRLGSLRFRLAAAMVLVLLLALAASTIGNRMAGPARGTLLMRALKQEPIQDGLVLATFGAAVLALIWAVSAWSLHPLARASREATEAGPSRPGARIAAGMLPTEIRPLVVAVNGALDRMEAAVEAERRFTADAAHELRTPLSILGLRLQRARAENQVDWEAVDQDLRQMNRLVAQLLDLARKEQAGRGAERERQAVNLSRIAREAAASMLQLVETQGRMLTVDLPESMEVIGRPDDLRDMVLNLLDNAVVHGSGGISLIGAERQFRCVLDVADEGPGVPEALQQEMFERFRKGRAASSGSGLGLAIVREVVSSHGGHVAFQPGGHALIRVELPRA